MFAGTSRDDSPFPVQYVGANVPQAWAAGSVFYLVRALVGASVDVENGVLLIDPFLPDWLPDLRIEGLLLGEQRVDVHFWREGDRTEAKITKGSGVQLVQRPFMQNAGPSPGLQDPPVAAAAS